MSTYEPNGPQRLWDGRWRNKVITHIVMDVGAGLRAMDRNGKRAATENCTSAPRGSADLREDIEQQSSPNHDGEDHANVIEMPSCGAFCVFHVGFLFVEFAVNITGINSTGRPAARILSELTGRDGSPRRRA